MKNIFFRSIRSLARLLTMHQQYNLLLCIIVCVCVCVYLKQLCFLRLPAIAKISAGPDEKPGILGQQPMGDLLFLI